MTRPSFVRSLGLAALLLTPGPLAAAQQAETPASRTSQSVRYELRFLDLHAAEVLAWDQCGQKEQCRVATLALPGDSNRRGYLEVLADSTVHEKIARALARVDSGPKNQNLQILLLAAGTKPAATGLEVPENAQKALADLKKFLPFKSYQLIDAAWLSATEGQVARGRLAGSGGAAYQVRLRFRSTGNAEAPSLFVDVFELGQEIVVTMKEGPHYGNRDLIQTTFSLKVGETIVVGTSKADGADGALVVLLTAVPAS
jgi:hypothetical protein